MGRSQFSVVNCRHSSFLNSLLAFFSQIESSATNQHEPTNQSTNQPKTTNWQLAGPQQICGEVGCAPPVDTKFEATFGERGLNCKPDKQEQLMGSGSSLAALWHVAAASGGRNTSNFQSTRIVISMIHQVHNSDIQLPLVSEAPEVGLQFQSSWGRPVLQIFAVCRAKQM